MPHSLASGLRRRLGWARRRRRARSPVWWANFGTASLWLGARRDLQAPALVIVSLPRSGSSWVGGTLGRAANAAYLREPLSQTWIERGGQRSVFPVDPRNPPDVYREAADAAFLGVPRFSRQVVEDPSQWRLSRRAPRRVVVKEVNPHACGWLVERYRVRVILLVRHPAAVALSYRKLGWFAGDGDAAAASWWEAHAAYQAAALRDALDALQRGAEHRVVTYEELCADPVGGFEQLCGFAGLEWGASVARFVRDSTSGGSRRGAWATTRDSRAMPRAWVDEVPPEDCRRLRDAYASYGLPWYASDRDW